MSWIVDWALAFLLTTIALRLWWFPKININSNYNVNMDGTKR
jgi:hypothetical protein